MSEPPEDERIGPGEEEPPASGGETLVDAEDDEPRRRAGRGALGCLMLLVVVGLLGAGAAFLVSRGVDQLRGAFGGPEDYDGQGSGSVLVQVRQGETAPDIGRSLERSGVVASVDAFVEAARKDDDRARGIQAGYYQMRKEMSARAALDILVDPNNLVQTQVTVPEGLRVEDTVALLAKETEATVKELEAALERPRKLGLPDYADGRAEGYLFPATYTIGPDDNATRILARMVDRWRQAAKEANLEQRARALGYTPHEVMTVASLVESEASRDRDRGKVARVIYNRLESDVTDGLLQIDATVNYALGRDLGLALSEDDLQVDSPYNTRRYPGLPPGPIESPGDKAIEAAANPPEGDWVYYVTVNLDTGETKFTDDYDQFLRWKNVELAKFCAGSDRC